MRVLKQNQQTRPRLSLILLDWGVRESLHVLHYLQQQTIPREAIEVVLLEYYDTVSKPAAEFESMIDTWVLLEMPSDCYYHKHLMYNAGTVLSKGEILMFADSDAMVRPTFVETVFKAFDRDSSIIYHMDEFRNIRRDFYPFNYPSFEAVVGEGCINNVDGKTKGILDEFDPMHTRNYGACMCARRDDIIGIGGADEDLTYLGHICGPYDMTFRLMNVGKRLVWEADEYLYHTWHPGSDGVANYLGPHDGRNMSTTAFQALCSGRVPPLVENEAIKRLRTGVPVGDAGSGLRDLLISPLYAELFKRSRLDGAVNGTFTAGAGRSDKRAVVGRSLAEFQTEVDSSQVRVLETVGVCNICEVGNRFAVVPHELNTVDLRVRGQRENPRIIWVNDLGEARKAAAQMSPSAVNRQVSLERALQVDITQLQLELSRLIERVATAERNLAAIYQSRTWRLFVAIGNVLQRVGKALGGRPN
jgi:hypothetical protein